MSTFTTPPPAHAKAPATTPTPTGHHGVVAGATTYQVLRVGGNLLSHSLPGAVPSARAGLASGFGKGPGVSPPPSTTDTPKKGMHSTDKHSEHMQLSPSANPPPQVMVVVGVLCQRLHSGREHYFSTCVCTRCYLPTTNCVLVFIGQLVPVTSTHYYASRSGLSTQSSPGNLKRNLISKQASRLDAFSGYPSRT